MVRPSPSRGRSEIERVRRSPLAGLASVASLTGDASSDQLFERSLAVFREAGDSRGTANVLLDLQLSRQVGGQLDRVVELGEEALKLCRELGDTGGQAMALFGLGTSKGLQGDFESAAPHLEESLALHLARGNELRAAQTLAGMAFVEVNRGDCHRARALLEDALAIDLRHDDAWQQAMDLTLLGVVELADGRWQRARELLLEGARLFRDIGNPLFLSWSLEGLAGVASEAGHPDLVARLCGAREAHQRRVGSSLGPVYAAGYERTLAAARAAMGEVAFDRASKYGQQEPLEDLLAEVSRGRLRAVA